MRKQSRQSASIEIDWIEQTRVAAGEAAGKPAAPPAGLLGRPFPNPTRAGIVIPLTVAAGGEHRLDVAIYDVVGRRVRTLVGGALHAGVHELDWDRRDDAGGKVGPGIYFVELTAGPTTESRKLVVID
jgi:hypothetical protein